MHWGLTIMQWCNYKIEEVILAAGAIGSPQLLLLSGIGPRPYLSSWGIPLTLHLPYVGQFLYHNPRNGINLLPSMPLEHSAYSGGWHHWIRGLPWGCFKQNSFPFLPILSSLDNHLLFYTSLWPQSWRRFISGSLSFGSLRLASTDVRVNSVVRFNCFTDPKDVETRLSGSATSSLEKYHLIKGKSP